MRLTEVSSDGVIFTDGNGKRVPIEELSDGYRSVLSMTFELIRQLSRAFGPELIFSPGDSSKINAPGVVLIDEVDAHLHPTWQQRVLGDLLRAFPGTQFIVTTHSPQVLSTVPRQNIRVLEFEDGQGVARIPDFSPLAHEAGDALAKVMGTLKEPPLPLQGTIRAFEQLVRIGQEDSQEAQQLRVKMNEAGYQIHQSDLVTWRFLAGRRIGNPG